MIFLPSSAPGRRSKSETTYLFPLAFFCRSFLLQSLVSIKLKCRRKDLFCQKSSIQKDNFKKKEKSKNSCFLFAQFSLLRRVYDFGLFLRSSRRFLCSEKGNMNKNRTWSMICNAMKSTPIKYCGTFYHCHTEEASYSFCQVRLMTMRIFLLLTYRNLPKFTMHVDGYSPSLYSEIVPAFLSSSLPFKIFLKTWPKQNLPKLIVIAPEEPPQHPLYLEGKPLCFHAMPIFNAIRWPVAKVEIKPTGGECSAYGCKKSSYVA